MRRVLIALALLASACSLGPREEWADAIHGSPEAVEAGTARVRMSMAVKVIETVIRQEPRPLISRLEGIVDFDRQVTRLVGMVPGKPVSFFDDLVAFLPRSKASIAAGRAKQRWVCFDFEREPSVELDDNDRRLAVGSGTIAPHLAVEMLEGVLTGSISSVGEETKAGKPATHYRAKVSQDAAAREIDDEDRREGLLRLFATLGQRDDVFPVDVWLDAQGRPAGIRFVMRQQKDRVNAFEMTLAWEFFDYGTKTDIKLPPSLDTKRSRRFRDFIVEYIREET